MSTIVQTVKRTKFLLLLFIISCAQVKTITPSNRFISPETAEDTGHGSLKAFIQTGTESTLEVYEDEFNEPMDINRNARIALGADIGIIENINIFYMEYSQSAPLLGLKYQILGPNKRKAKKGDYSLAITVGGGASTETRTNDDTDDFIFDDYEVDKASILRNLLDASIIYGKRIKDRLLWYSTISISQHRLHVKVQDSDTSIDNQKINYQTTNLGLASGLTMYDKKGRFSLSVEASFQKTKWTKNDETHLAFLSGSMGFNW